MTWPEVNDKKIRDTQTVGTRGCILSWKFHTFLLAIVAVTRSQTFLEVESRPDLRWPGPWGHTFHIRCGKDVLTGMPKNGGAAAFSYRQKKKTWGLRGRPNAN